MRYQETLKIDAKNINKNINTIWRPIYEVINVVFFEETSIFPQHFLDLCRKVQIKLSFYHLMSEHSWKCGYQTMVICTSDQDPSKGFGKLKKRPII